MRFEYVWISVGGAEGFHNLGVLLRHGRRLSWSPIAQASVSQVVQDLVDTANLQNTTADLWDYLLDRGIGGLSSVTRPQALTAKSWTAAQERALETSEQVQAWNAA